MFQAENNDMIEDLKLTNLLEGGVIYCPRGAADDIVVHRLLLRHRVGFFSFFAV